MIRLARIGKKKSPIYRIVVSEKARDMYGKALEIVGHYNPSQKTLEIKADRVKHWISKGAQASETIHNLLVENKIIESKKVPVTHISKKKQAKNTKKEEEAKKNEPTKPNDTDEENKEGKIEKKPETETKVEEKAEEKAEEKPKAEEKTE